MVELTVSCAVGERTDVETFARAQDLEDRTSNKVYRYLSCRACTPVYMGDPPAEGSTTFTRRTVTPTALVEEATATTDRVSRVVRGCRGGLSPGLVEQL